MKRLVLADDHAIVRRGLRELIIEESEGLTLAGEAESGDQLLALLRSQPVDVVILDLALGDRDGVELLDHVCGEFPNISVLVLTLHAEELFAERVLRAGARGYVQKNSDEAMLLAAIRCVAAGGTYVSPALAEILARRVRRGTAGALPHECLSGREFEVFRLLGRGKTVTEVAKDLNLSVKTVSTHRSHIVTKTALQTNADFVDYVTAHGLR
ncbi:MAG TPA: response regulator transcription factor [Thermoanaerobaculia bacterium]|nr:response regulator transcription factor [Thermoanaerobaculia bacterium]